MYSCNFNIFGARQVGEGRGRTAAHHGGLVAHQVGVTLRRPVVGAARLGVAAAVRRQVCTLGCPSGGAPSGCWTCTLPMCCALSGRHTAKNLQVQPSQGTRTGAGGAYPRTRRRSRRGRSRCRRCRRCTPRHQARCRASAPRRPLQQGRVPLIGNLLQRRDMISNKRLSISAL